MEVDRYLQDLEDRINPEVEDQLIADWRAFCDREVNSGAFSAGRTRTTLPKLEWPEIRVNQALVDFDMMVLQQYRSCSAQLSCGGGGLLAVRSNYGSSILPSVFGVENFIMPDEQDVLPGSHPISGGKEGIRKLLDRGVPELNTGWGEKVFEMGRRYVAIGQEYPKIGKYVGVFHPDLQGPMDVTEVVWGSSLFLDIMDEPDLAKDFLELVTETYIAFLDAWQDIVPVPRYGEHSMHWGMMHPGTIMLRDDSAMNFSPKVFEEFIFPYNQRLLTRFGGGAIHYCGHGDHFVPVAAKLDQLRAINLSQPEMNNMDVIFDHTVDKDILILGLKRHAAEEAMAAGRDLRGMVHI